MCRPVRFVGNKGMRQLLDAVIMIAAADWLFAKEVLD
jgi:hypothetical protein